MVVRKLSALGWLAEPGSEVQRAREEAEAGDPSWGQWVEELERGEALLIDMRVSVDVELDDGSQERVDADDHQVWVHAAQHPPVMASMIAELAGKDFGLLAHRLEEAGAHVSEADLGEMHVAVELADDLLGALRPPENAVAGRTPEHAARLGIETEPT